MANNRASSVLADDIETMKVLFTEARSQNGFIDKPVSATTLRRLYDLVKMGPTSTNCLPARFIFVQSAGEKENLVSCMAPPNQSKVASAPVTVIIGMDLDFVDTLPKLFPHSDMSGFYKSSPNIIPDTAFRNSSLQGGYLILAARALGLDCGPMSGFNSEAVDAAFWAGTNVKTNFVCTLGYGDPTKVFARLPRHDFGDVCKLV
jgi:3-hydroxypropanoate dehydrogenase